MSVAKRLRFAFEGFAAAGMVCAGVGCGALEENEALGAAAGRCRVGFGAGIIAAGAPAFNSFSQENCSSSPQVKLANYSNFMSSTSKAICLISYL